MEWTQWCMPGFYYKYHTLVGHFLIEKLNFYVARECYASYIFETIIKIEQMGVLGFYGPPGQK